MHLLKGNISNIYVHVPFFQTIITENLNRIFKTNSVNHIFHIFYFSKYLIKCLFFLTEVHLISFLLYWKSSLYPLIIPKTFNLLLSVIKQGSFYRWDLLFVYYIFHWVHISSNCSATWKIVTVWQFVFSSAGKLPPVSLLLTWT